MPQNFHQGRGGGVSQEKIGSARSINCSRNRLRFVCAESAICVRRSYDSSSIVNVRRLRLRFSVAVAILTPFWRVHSHTVCRRCRYGGHVSGTVSGLTFMRCAYFDQSGPPRIRFLAQSVGSEELRSIRKAEIAPGLYAFYYHRLTFDVC